MTCVKYVSVVYDSGLMTIRRARKTKMLGDAEMEKMDFQPWNHSTDVMASCAPTRQNLGGTGKSQQKIKCLQTIFVWEESIRGATYIFRVDNSCFRDRSMIIRGC